MEKRIDNISLEQLPKVAQEIVDTCNAGDVFVIVGELGTGKTTLVSEIAEQLRSTVQATSPTFAIISEYPLKYPVKGIEKIIHIDTYRLNHVNELYDLGLETLFDKNSVTFIEWGERIEEFIDHDHYKISIKEVLPDVRSYELVQVKNMKMD